MRFHVLTLFPELFDGFCRTSIIGRAIASGDIEVLCSSIRDFSVDRHRRVDDAPFGGGAGMVMQVQPLRDAVLSAKAVSPNAKVLLMSPRGATLTQQRCVELAQEDALILVCGRYEGIDQRFIDRYVDEEISIGDYVLTGGEIPAMVVIESVGRLRDSVLGNDASAESESFSEGLLEYPQYTRPDEIDGDRVPDVLLSGHHAQIERWRKEQAERITRERRPDLWERYRGL